MALPGPTSSRSPSPLTRRKPAVESLCPRSRRSFSRTSKRISPREPKTQNRPSQKQQHNPFRASPPPGSRTGCPDTTAGSASCPARPAPRSWPRSGCRCPCGLPTPPRTCCRPGPARAGTPPCAAPCPPCRTRSAPARRRRSCTWRPRPRRTAP
ncbi:hypothetical protein VTK73DRAFT_6297 [Phialemonium thermophilum]|uniref:Uncharacterized protein n=1 Tax=Phialemonium thermophilum TaxID=223376 RepID=A0ABR3UZY9_9PEZI